MGKPIGARLGMTMSGDDMTQISVSKPMTPQTVFKNVKSWRVESIPSAVVEFINVELCRLYSSPNTDATTIVTLLSKDIITALESHPTQRGFGRRPQNWEQIIVEMYSDEGWLCAFYTDRFVFKVAV